MNPSSVFLRIKEHILVEFIYSQEPITASFKKYVNITDGTEHLVNNYNSRMITNNVEDFFSVNSNVGYMAVVDLNDGFYYPNSNPSIQSQQLPVGVNLKYDTVKFHVRSGYNFQDVQGLFSNIYIKTAKDVKISLLSQVVFKGDISKFKYNNTPLRISETTFDKYVEYKILSVSEILDGSNQTSSYFGSNFTAVKTNPVIYLDFGFVTEVDSSDGFVKFYNAGEETVYIPAYDGFSNLQPSLVEKESYFEYSAQWNGESIENFITIMNSKAGNAYHIEHEIAVYEQRGFDFYEVQRHNTVQKYNYDLPLKFRPIISNNVNGSLQIEYIMKFFNTADNTSVVKRAMLNTMNTNPYMEEPIRIAVPINEVHKVYNKVIRKDINIDNKKSLLDNKIIVPIYYSNVAVKVDEDFLVELVPFDNIYSIYINQEINGQDTPLNLDPTVQYQMVFITSAGEKIRVIENDVTGKINGILNFKISSEQSKIILRDNNGKFYINSVNDAIETNVTVGEWINKESKKKGVVDTIITSNDLLQNQSQQPIDSVSTSIPLTTVSVTDDNITELQSNSNIVITKNDNQDFDVQDIPKDVVTDTIKNPIVGETKQVKIIPDGKNMPISVMIKSLENLANKKAYDEYKSKNATINGFLKNFFKINR